MFCFCAKMAATKKGGSGGPPKGEWEEEWKIASSLLGGDGLRMKIPTTLAVASMVCPALVRARHLVLKLPVGVSPETTNSRS